MLIRNPDIICEVSSSSRRESGIMRPASKWVVPPSTSAVYRLSLTLCPHKFVNVPHRSLIIIITINVVALNMRHVTVRGQAIHIGTHRLLARSMSFSTWGLCPVLRTTSKKYKNQRYRGSGLYIQQLVHRGKDCTEAHQET